MAYIGVESEEVLKLIIGFVLIQDKGNKAKEQCIFQSFLNVQPHIIITSTIFRF